MVIKMDIDEDLGRRIRKIAFEVGTMLTEKEVAPNIGIAALMMIIVTAARSGGVSREDCLKRLSSNVNDLYDNIEMNSRANLND